VNTITCTLQHNILTDKMTLLTFYISVNDLTLHFPTLKWQHILQHTRRVSYVEQDGLHFRST